MRCSRFSLLWDLCILLSTDFEIDSVQILLGLLEFTERSYHEFTKRRSIRINRRQCDTESTEKSVNKCIINPLKVIRASIVLYKERFDQTARLVEFVTTVTKVTMEMTDLTKVKKHTKATREITKTTKVTKKSTKVARKLSKVTRVIQKKTQKPQ